MDIVPSEVERIVPRFTGTIYQVPPMFSALKKDGRRLHDLAREGQNVERDARPVDIHDLEILSVGPGPYPLVTFRVVCGKGTYVRSLADDMAAALGGSAHLTALHRVRIGSLAAADGLTVDGLAEWKPFLLSPTDALRDLPSVTVGTETAVGVSHGMRFVGGELMTRKTPGPFRVIDESGQLIAVYRVDGDQARPEVVLPL